MGWAKQRRPRLDLPLMLSSQVSCVIVSALNGKNRHVIFLALVALKLLVSLISRLVASLVPRPFCYAHAREGNEGSGK